MKAFELKVFLPTVLYIYLISFNSIATGLSMPSNDNYQYKASEGAPKNYPMQIISGSLNYHDNSGSLAVPKMTRVSNGWGDWRSSHVSRDEERPLPNKLSLIYFSYMEDQFFKGEFDLPIEKIQALFDTGYYSLNQEENVTFDKFIVGMAPGGYVTVWVSGFDKTIEVFSGYAEKIEGDWSWVYDGDELSREAYLKMIIDDKLSSINNVDAFREQELPLGRWEKYSNKRYFWEPVLNNIKIRDDLINIIHFYNGEKDYLNVPLGDFHKGKTLAVPDSMDITWNRTGFLVNDLTIEIFFDEKEIFSVFETLGKENTPLKLELKMDTEKNNNFTIWLRNEKESVELKHFTMKTWKPGGARYSEAGPKDTE